MKFKYFRSICYLMSLAMFMSPIAEVQAKEAIFKHAFSESYKKAGLNREATLGQFYNNIKAELPYELNYKIQKFVEKNQNIKLSKFDISEIKSGNNSGYRLTFKLNNQLKSLDFIEQGEDLKLKTPTGLKSLTEIYYASDFNLNVNRSYVMPLTDVFAHAQTNPKEAAQYLTNLRRLVQSLEQVEAAQYGQQDYFAWNTEDAASATLWSILLQPNESWATPKSPVVGGKCVMAGYLTNYSYQTGTRHLSCGTNDRFISEDRGSCNNTELPCNPLIYGAEKNGKILCVAKSNPMKVSQTCDSKNPVDNDDGRSQYLKSVMARNKDQNFNQQQILDSLQAHITKGIDYCFQEVDKVKAKTKLDNLATKGKGSFAAGSINTFDPKDREFIGRFPNKSEEHDRVACATLMNRLLTLKSSEAQLVCSAPVSVVIVKPPLCPNDGTVTPAPVATGEQAPPAVAPAPPVDPVLPAAEDKKDDDHNWLPWVIGFSMVALIALLHRRNRRNHTGSDPVGGVNPPIIMPPVTVTTLPVTPPTPTLPPAVGKPGEDSKPRTGSGGVK